MYNKVIMIGNLTRDVELRYFPSGTAMATIGLASNRRYKKQDGTQGEEVCFVDVKLIGRTAEVANQYLKKGSKILIEGRLTLESWTDQTGAKRSRHTISADSMQMLDTRSSTETQSYAEEEGYTSYGSTSAPVAPVSAQMPQHTMQQQAPQQTYANINHYQQNIPEINIDDDEIPF